MRAAARPRARKSRKRRDARGGSRREGRQNHCPGPQPRETRRSPRATQNSSPLKKPPASWARWRLSGCVAACDPGALPHVRGAIVNARMDRVFSGGLRAKIGAFGEHLNLNDFALNHRPEQHPGRAEEECLLILPKLFLAASRAQKIAPFLFRSRPNLSTRKAARLSP